METPLIRPQGRFIPAPVMIRGIPKEGWKQISSWRRYNVPERVMIRGIPKEGWKLGVAVGPGIGVAVG
jgi:hypothetical protein